MFTAAYTDTCVTLQVCKYNAVRLRRVLTVGPDGRRACNTGGRSPCKALGWDVSLSLFVARGLAACQSLPSCHRSSFDIGNGKL